MPILHAQAAGLQDMAVHTTVAPTPAPEIVREAAPAPEIAREAAGEAVLMSASPALTQHAKFAMELGRNLMMTISISYGRAGCVVGIETTAILGMSYVIHVVAEGALTAIGRVKCKNQFRTRAAKERSRKMSMWKLPKRGLAFALVEPTKYSNV
jgi:hypothetical protein